LTLKGERKDDTTDSKRTYFAREIGGGAFSRSFRLPTDADTNKVSASFKEGMLTVGVPKREEAKPRRISIE
jgi:HSP20 family protein